MRSLRCRADVNKHSLGLAKLGLNCKNNSCKRSMRAFEGSGRCQQGLYALHAGEKLSRSEASLLQVLLSAMQRTDPCKEDSFSSHGGWTGPHYKGILLFGGPYQGSPVFVNLPFEPRMRGARIGSTLYMSGGMVSTASTACRQLHGGAGKCGELCPCKPHRKPESPTTRKVTNLRRDEARKKTERRGRANLLKHNFCKVSDVL